ncbi:MAG: hypothetical protein IIB73_10705 [Proteobacteria bacterium]|nr:hypothetical protein [Pseudomonadota bacterium]
MKKLTKGAAISSFFSLRQPDKQNNSTSCPTADSRFNGDIFVWKNLLTASQAAQLGITNTVGVIAD